MRGTIHTQVEGLFHTEAKGIGVSRHQMKLQQITDTLIHSDNTRATYVRVWHSIADYSVQHFAIAQIAELTPEMAKGWIEGRVSAGLAPSTIKTYLAAVTKLFQVLEVYRGKRKNHA